MYVSPIYVTTLSTLAPLGSRQVLFVDGYSSTGDGGEGNFYWEASYSGASSPMTVIPAGHTTGAWVRVFDKERINIQWFGAVPGISSASNTASIQAAIGWAGSTYEVFVPPVGPFFTTQPLTIKSSNAVLSGGYRSAGSFTKSCLRSDTFVGPIVMIGGNNYTVPPAYVQRGNLWYFNPGAGLYHPFIAMSEYAAASLNGLPQFCFETWINITAAPSTNGYIFCSFGSKSLNTSPTSAVQLYVNDYGGGKYGLTFTLTTNHGGGTSYKLVTTSDTLIAGATDTKIACSYDGSFMRVYVNGQFVQHLQAVGAIVQNWWESVNEGVLFNQAYNQAQVFNQPSFEFASIRLSNTARYTSEAGGTPYPPGTMELAYDSNTMLLFNFNPSNVSDNFVIAQSNLLGAAGCRVWHELQQNRGQGVSSVRLKDLDIQSGNGCCVLADGAPNCGFERVGGVGFTGISLYNNCYLNTFRDCYLMTVNPFSGANGWSAGIFLRDVSGISEINSCQVRSSWQWAYLVINTSDAYFFKNYALSAGLGVWYCSFSSCQFENNYPTDEGGIVNEATLYVNQCLETRYTGGELQNFSGPSSSCLVRVDGGTWLYFDTNYQAISVPAFSFVAQPTNPVVANGATRSPAAPNNPATMIDALHPGLLTTVWDTSGLDNYNFPSDANQTMTGNQYLFGTIKLTGTLTAARTLTIPFITIAGYKRTWINSTSGSVTIVGASGTGVTIAKSKSASTITDGTNVVRLTPDT